MVKKINAMKQKIFLLTLLFTMFVLSSNGGTPKPPWEQENVSFPMINSEIRNSLDEHEVQKELRTEQSKNLVAERTNREQWTKYKEVSKKVQDRLRIVAFSLQMIPTGYVVSQEAKTIKRNQELIYEELRTAPYAIIVIFPAQLEFLDDLQMTTRLLAGIVVSYGAINQMERAERQQLLNYALDEVKMVRKKSDRMLRQIKNFKEALRRRKSLLRYYVNRDKRIVEDIIKNAKGYGKL